MSFKEEYDRRVRAIEEILDNYLPNAVSPLKTITEAMRYSVMGSAKRLRPMLMWETYRLFGGEGRVIEPFCAAIEMIHTYSLVHDDLPAMDDDDYRRGRKTTHAVYGEAMGILTGDALLNYAFETVAVAFYRYREESLKIAKAMSVLAGKSGIHGMIGGQVLDIEANGREISREELNVMYGLKTGALLEASMMTGAILAGAGEDEVRAMESVASKVGAAFQIRDDILDVKGDINVLGKPVLSDEKNKKTTYVTIMGPDKASEYCEKLSIEAIGLLKHYAPDGAFLTELIENLVFREK